MLQNAMTAKKEEIIFVPKDVLHIVHAITSCQHRHIPRCTP